VLVTTVVAGGIAILRPFTAASRPFLRDIIFYMAAVLLIFTALYCGRVTLAWALGEPLRDQGGIPPGLTAGRHRAREAGALGGGVEMGAGGLQGTESPLVPSDGSTAWDPGGLGMKGNLWFRSPKRAGGSRGDVLGFHNFQFS